MAQVRSESVAQRRFVLLLVAAFGALGAGDGGGRRLRRDGAHRQRTHAGDRHPARARARPVTGHARRW
jgi:hypothetical protein